MNPLNRKAGWMVWLVIFIPFLYLAIMVMPQVSRDIKQVALDPECAHTLDEMIFGVNQKSADKTLSCMGEEGRGIYRKAARIQDSLYPVSYTLVFLFTFFALGSFLFGKRKTFLLMLILPLAGMAFDFYENNTVITLIDEFPDLQSESISQASFAGNVKWVLAFTNLLMLIVLALMSLRKVIRK